MRLPVIHPLPYYLKWSFCVQFGLGLMVLQQLIQNMIKIQTFSNMFDIKKSRTHKADTKSIQKSNEPSQSFLPTKKALQKLSLSFYGQDTMKKNKQIIFDNCEIFQSLPQISSLMKQRICQQKKKFKQSLRSSTVNKDINLKIDALFMDQKLDEFEFVTTNASQPQTKIKEKPSQLKKKVSRSNSVKIKEVNQKNKKQAVIIDVYSARCKTSKCVSRKSKLMDKRPKKK